MLTVRPVGDEDCRLLWEWVNDPGVRQASFESHQIAWEEHVAWFRATRGDPRRVIFIILDDNRQPVGQVRFEPQDADGGAEIIISIAGDHRGRGVGAEALSVACEAYRPLGLAQRVMAYIKPENAASVRIFEKAGFTKIGTQPFRGHAAVWMIFELSRRPLQSQVRA